MYVLSDNLAYSNGTRHDPLVRRTRLWFCSSTGMLLLLSLFLFSLVFVPDTQVCTAAGAHDEMALPSNTFTFPQLDSARLHTFASIMQVLLLAATPRLLFHLQC
ncbi:hypothetical protein TRVL_02030 [Trypanosoma vivax]|uniref:Uncharacterized protein n=1 Tax=Trypanosoma vivax (strain Y486) TaxID=1055687 RepID=G0U5U4_TRYVY|nr:hypothetical protein TRVL_02030 [Trypanosoma vivax]CCC51245.1 conserved hypothetical protein [Trypanosoma vivax Y486]